jgi:hypothetical protein
MTWHRVWKRTFATEEEADVAYDRLLASQEHRLEFMVVDVDRETGNSLTVAYSDIGLEAVAQAIEKSYHPPEPETACTCGHQFSVHDHEDEESVCHVCQCPGFDRADWPPKEWGTIEEVRP